MYAVKKYHNLRYKPKRQAFFGCQKPPVFDEFDLVIWWPDSLRASRLRTRSPQNILCLAHPKSFQILNKLRGIAKNATIIIAGEDTLLSVFLRIVHPDIVEQNTIYFEAKDVCHSTIKSFSMGFISYYLKRIGNDDLTVLIKQVADADWKKHGVLAAWGGIWSHLDNTLDDRRAAVEMVEKSNWLKREVLNANEYWQRLAEVKYLIAPAGQGIQAPKLAEAWLMRTVPIVTRNPCFEDLQKKGYPLCIVEDWGSLSLSIVAEWESTYISIDWKRVEHMLTTQYFVEEYLRR